MGRKRIHPIKPKSKAPLLSEVEMAGLLAWFDYELEVARRELGKWRHLARSVGDPMSVGERDFYDVAVRVLHKARQQAEQTLEARLRHGKLAKPVSDLGAFLDRMGATG